jgi:hypothetical protein
MALKRLSAREKKKKPNRSKYTHTVTYSTISIFHTFYFFDLASIAFNLKARCSASSCVRGVGVVDAVAEVWLKTIKNK